MNYYEIWFNLKNTHRDLEFCEHLNKYLGHLEQMGLLETFSLTRRKLGFGPSTIGEFHVTMGVRDMAQLEQLFDRIARREGEIESLHRAVYSAVQDTQFALYRDFPDPVRDAGSTAGRIGFGTA